jgi:flagellar biosynthesis protein FlhF
MRLKTFYAKTMTEAMRQVRDTLGEDAIIIATRDENGGRSVRVTAAIEQADDHDFDDPHYDPLFEDFDVPPPQNMQFSNDLRGAQATQSFKNQDGKTGRTNEQLTDVMLRHVVPNDVMDNILATATMSGLVQQEAALAAALDHLYGFTPLPLKTRKALMIVGPPGAGKTLMVAKLATKAVMDGLSVAVITTDTVRAGGVEQLHAFTKILKTKLYKAKTRDDLNSHLRDAKGHDLILIDTAGTNPHDPDDMARIARLADAGSIEPILAMTAGIDAEEASEISRSFALLGVQRMVSTRLDVARRLGGLLAAAQKGGMQFCQMSFSPRVTDGLDIMDANGLAAFLINADKKLRKYSNKETQPTETKTKINAGRAR